MSVSGFPETSVSNCQWTLHNITEDQIPWQNNLVYLLNDEIPGILWKPVVGVKIVWYNSGALWVNKKYADYSLNYVDWKTEAWEWNVL